MGKQVYVNIVEVKQPDMDAQLVAEKIALDLENRISFRRAMKQAIGRAMRLVSRPRFPAVWAVLKSLVLKAITKEPFRCRPSVQTSTMVLLKHTLLMVVWA